MGLSALLSLLRLKFSIPSLVSALVAFTMARYHYGVSFTLNFLLALLVVFLVTSAGLVINEYYDYELDVFSGRDDLPLVRGEVDRRTARRVYLLLFALALTLSALISTAALATTAIASALAVAYSRPPLRFKARPLLDSLTNGLTYGPITMALVFESLKLPVVWAVVYSIPFFIFLSAGHMLLAVPTINEDLSLNVRTSAAVLGKERAILVGAVLFAVASLLAVGYSMRGYYPRASLLFLPFMAYSIFQLWMWRRGEDKERAFRRMEASFTAGALAFLLPFFL